MKNLLNNKYKRYALFIIFLLLSYFGIDFLTRSAAALKQLYFWPIDLITTKFALAWSFLFCIFYMLFPKKIGKKIYIISLIILNIYSLAQLIHLNLLGRMFTIFDIFSAKEGFTYITGIITHLNLFSFLVILYSILISYFTCYFWPEKNIESRYQYTLYFIFIITFLALRTSNITYLTNDNVNYSFDSNKNHVKVYKNFNNPTSALELTGIYEYIYKDISLSLTYNEEVNTEDINMISNYLDERNLAKENTYTGLFKDKNVIMIMLESVDNLFLNNEVMPNLYSLKDDSLYFTNRYTPIFGTGATFNTEFTSLTGTYSSTIGKAAYFYTQNDYQYSLPNIFKNNGYVVNSFHMNDATFYDRGLMHQAFGFNKYNSFKDYTGKMIYSDSEILNYDNIYNAIAPADKKFFSFIVTYSAHMPYTWENHTCNNYMQDNLVEDNDYETSCYKSALYDTDKFIGMLIDRLKEDNLLDDTVIILYGDHLPYAYNKRVAMGEEEDYNVNKGLYLIYNPTIKGKKIDTINTTIDMVPTILNLFALEGYNPNNYLGVDVFNKDALHIAYFSDYNWIDNNYYSANLSKKEYLDNKEYIDKINNYVEKQINYNNKIVMGNYYKYK